MSEEKSFDKAEVACSAVSDNDKVQQDKQKARKQRIKATPLCLRVGRARHALTLTNQHGRAVKSAAQTAPRTTSSRGDTDLTHWNSDGSSRRRRPSDSTSRYEKNTLTPVPPSIPCTHSLTCTIIHLYICLSPTYAPSKTLFWRTTW